MTRTVTDIWQETFPESMGEQLQIGRKTGDIDVSISYKIVELFSAGLYSSPNKAVEELVANSFDAGAKRVHVLVTQNIADRRKDASIVVIDDGSGMGPDELKQHWRIGVSDKRARPPRGRLQIGKFGIGKLATYVLANRLTHIGKRDGKYFTASMDYSRIGRDQNSDVSASKTFQIELYELTGTEAKQLVNQHARSFGFQEYGMPLFGEDGPDSWTICVMSDLKPKAADIKIGRVEWILGTALPLSSDFSVWLNGKKIESRELSGNRIRRWVIGKDLTELPHPAPEVGKDYDGGKADDLAHGVQIPEVGRVTGYAEAYKDPLPGCSDENRSCGFFVYVRGRLVNVADGHFGIPANELRHGTFNRFRAVVHMDYLDEGLRSTRESIEDSAALIKSRNLLRAIFNYVRSQIETHDREEDPASRLAGRLAAGRSSLSRKPLALLARSVAEGKTKSRHLIVPAHESGDEREKFLSEFTARMESPGGSVTKISVNDGSASDPIAKFDTESMALNINASHPFVSAFRDEFTSKRHAQPLELLAMAEILYEAHMHYEGIEYGRLENLLDGRDCLLRNLAAESKHQSPFAIADELVNASDPKKLEELVCDAFRSLGFEVESLGGRDEPDGTATAILPADGDNNPQRYKVSLEAKSGSAPISAHSIGVIDIVRHGLERRCDHVVVVGRGFRTSMEGSASERNIREATAGKPITITLITTADLAELIKQRPVKMLGLKKIRELFKQCGLPDQCKEWIQNVKDQNIEQPKFRTILETVKNIADESDEEPVRYNGLRLMLGRLNPPVKYKRDSQLGDVCKAMAQMSQGAVWADDDRVELDQSVENAIASIEKAIQECGGASKAGSDG